MRSSGKSFALLRRLSSCSSSSVQRIDSMLFWGPALFGAGCAVWLAGVAIVYGAALTRGDRRRD
jgi:hypothetical protein